MPYINKDPRSPARIRSGVGNYIQDSCGGNQPETDLNYSLAPENTIALAPLPDDPLQRGAWGSSLNGLGAPRMVPFQAGIGDCGCGCAGGSLGDLTSDLTSLTSDPTSLLLLAGGALLVGVLLFSGGGKKARRKAMAKARDQYLAKRYSLAAA